MNTGSFRQNIWWVVPGELAGMPLPTMSPKRTQFTTAPAHAFDDDVHVLYDMGIRSVIAAFELQLHREIFGGSRFNYLSIPIEEGFAPDSNQADKLTAFYESSSRPLAVYCEGGIDRTGTLLAIILVHRGLSAHEAVKAVKAVMPAALENRRQLAFIGQYARRVAASRKPLP